MLAHAGQDLVLQQGQLVLQGATADVGESAVLSAYLAV